MNIYDVGDVVRVIGEFTDLTDTAIDPAIVKFDYKKPSDVAKTTRTYGDGYLQKSAVGIYYIDLDATESGWWVCKFYSTTSGQAAGPHKFLVQESLL